MSLRQKTLSGLAWSGMAQAGRQISNLMITAVLARLLLPEDFGLLGMATVFVQFALVVSEFGVVNALVQRAELSPAHLDAAFWLNAALSALAAAAFFLAAPWVAGFYGQPLLVGVLRGLSLSFILTGLGLVQHALLMRSMEFRPLMIRDLAAVAVSGAAGITLAAAGFGVWALVAQQVTLAGVNTALMWKFSRWRPRFAVEASAVRDLWTYSWNMAGLTLSNTLARNIDYLLIGKWLGAQPLGLYTLAYKLMMLPLQQFSWVVGRVLFPGFSRIQEDLARVRLNYLRLVKAVSLVTFPLMTAMAISAPEIVPAVFGPKWTGAVPLIQVLSLCGLLQSVGTTVGIIYQSQGKPDVQFRFTLFFSMPTAVAAIAFGLRFGILGVAIAYTARTAVVTYFSHAIANRIIGLSMRDFLACQKQSLLVAALVGGAMGGASLLCALQLPPGAYGWSLLLEGGAGAAAFLAAVSGLGIASWFRQQLSGAMA